jgi:hypothetical protein
VIVTRGVIASSRDQVAGHVSTVGLATYTYLPDDVAHLPCLVVGRPSIRESFTSGVMGVELDVTLLGRRISDEDSQAELDAYADQLFDVLGGTRNVSIDGAFYRCTLFVPGTVLVAGLEYPAYIATVTTETVTC